MQPCPSCAASSFSLMNAPSGPDGTQCPNCGTRVRFKRYALYPLIWAVGVFPLAFLSWPVKLFAFITTVAIVLVVTNRWPLVVHPWDRTRNGEDTGSEPEAH